MGKIKITQTRSSIKSNGKQKNTLIALGIRKMGQTVLHEDTPQIKGMTRNVSHLVKVENVE